MKKLFAVLLAMVASAGTMLAHPMRISPLPKVLTVPTEKLKLSEPTFVSNHPIKAPKNKSASSDKVQIGDLYYILDEEKKMAEVTYQDLSNNDNYNTLTSVVIPSIITYGGQQYNVVSIGYGAFAYCQNLTSVNLPQSISILGDYAFCQCPKITSITIPENVTSIGKFPFSGCSNLSSVEWRAKNCQTSRDEQYVYPPFQNCANIATFSIGENVESLPTALCYGLPITSISIPYSVKSIGDAAFRDCTGLTSIIIPEKVSYIGKYPFYGCSSLLSATWNAIDCSFPTPINTIDENGEPVTYRYAPFDGCEKSITTFLFGDNVENIPDFLCAGMENVSSITIPNSVKNIGEGAFVNCHGLTSATMGNGVTSIGIFAFSFCDGLTSVTIGSSVTNIGSYAFHTCTSMTSVTIPNSVTTIGDYAFNGCSSLTSVSIPGSVTNIKTGAFIYCHSLNSIDVSSDNANYSSIDGVLFSKDATQLIIYPAGKQGEYVVPNGTKTIIAQAFADCGKITSVIIPNSVTSIEEYAFAECSALETITIGANVSNLGEGAFWACSNIKTIYNYVTTPQSITSVMFDGYEDYPAVDKTTCKLYVPAESVALYKAADVWKEFTNILPIEGTSATPSVMDVRNAGYNPDNNIVFCVHFTEEANVCNDIVWAGTYNSWNTNIDQMLTFSHLVGFDNWYAVEFPYAEETAGVPVSLKLDGSFSWDYICGPGNAWMYKGGKEAFITNVLDDKIDAIRFYDGAGVYMYEMTYWNQHRDPCVQLPVHTYTVNLYAPNACSDMKPAVIGDFNNWDIYSVSAMSELTDTNGKKYYSYSFNDEELHSFKIVAADEYEVDWNTEMKHFDATKGGWVTVENYILSADSIITLDWSDNRHYRYGTCETGLPDPTTYTITFVNDDGSIIDSRAWEEGTMPTCAEPSKPDDDYMYCFAGWQPQIVAVSETSTYQATYDVCGGWISDSFYWKLQGDTLIVDGSGVIPDYAQGTAPWSSYAGRINVVYIEDGISRIGEWAFADMSMNVVRIPGSVTVIGANAFKGSSSVENVYFGGSASQWATINFVNEYSNPLFYGANLDSEDAPITTVIVPNTITEISTNSFIGIGTVEITSIEDWCNITIISSDYTPSYELTINGVPVTEVCLQEGVTHINANAFRGCRSIRSVCIPASMQQIGTDAFSHTPNLAKVLYAGTLAQWCDITFANAEANPACHADLYFDDEKLGTRIDIPASLTSIRAFAFPNKETLNVYFHSTNPNGYMLNSFGEPQEVGDKHFYVPCGTKENYQKQLNYSESLFTENYPFSYQVLSEQEAMGKVQVVHAPDCEDQQLQIKAIPNAEYRFVQWSDGSTEAERALTLHSDTILKATFAIDSVTIRFFMDDGTLYVEKNVKYGEMPVVEDPQKESTVQYTYTFARWNPELKPATYDMSYKAVFDRTVNTYMVYFINWDGVLLGEQEVAYGSAALPPAVPEREHYHFVGWNTNIYMITGRTFAVAQFKKNGGYTIHYRNGVDDSEIDGEEIDLNFPEPPVIEGFVFVGWEIVCGSVITEGIEIQAVYEPSTADAIDNEVVNPANPVQKLIRNGNVYILTDDNTYTIQGQKVK